MAAGFVQKLPAPIRERFAHNAQNGEIGNHGFIPVAFAGRASRASSRTIEGTSTVAKNMKAPSQLMREPIGTLGGFRWRCGDGACHGENASIGVTLPVL